MLGIVRGDHDGDLLAHVILAERLLLKNRVSEGLNPGRSPENSVHSLIALQVEGPAIIGFEITGFHLDQPRTIVLDTHDVIEHVWVHGMCASSGLDI
jgi:hypothetical protein